MTSSDTAAPRSAWVPVSQAREGKEERLGHLAKPDAEKLAFSISKILTKKRRLHPQRPRTLQTGPVIKKLKSHSTSREETIARPEWRVLQSPQLENKKEEDNGEKTEELDAKLRRTHEDAELLRIVRAGQERAVQALNPRSRHSDSNRGIGEILRVEMEGLHPYAKLASSLPRSLDENIARVLIEEDAGDNPKSTPVLDRMVGLKPSLTILLYRDAFVVRSLANNYHEGSARIYDRTTREFLRMIDLGLIPYELLELAPCVFYDGNVIVELQDLRHTPAVAGSGSAHEEGAIVRRVLLQPTNESFARSLNLAVHQRQADPKSKEIDLSTVLPLAEEKLLRALYQAEDLCLDPNPEVFVATTVINCNKLQSKFALANTLSRYRSHESPMSAILTRAAAATQQAQAAVPSVPNAGARKKGRGQSMEEETGKASVPVSGKQGLSPAAARAALAEQAKKAAKLSAKGTKTPILAERAQSTPTASAPKGARSPLQNPKYSNAAKTPPAVASKGLNGKEGPRHGDTESDFDPVTQLLNSAFPDGSLAQVVSSSLLSPAGAVGEAKEDPATTAILESLSLGLPASTSDNTADALAVADPLRSYDVLNSLLTEEPPDLLGASQFAAILQTLDAQPTPSGVPDVSGRENIETVTQTTVLNNRLVSKLSIAFWKAALAFCAKFNAVKQASTIRVIPQQNIPHKAGNTVGNLSQQMNLRQREAVVALPSDIAEVANRRRREEARLRALQPIAAPSPLRSSSIGGQLSTTPSPLPSTPSTLNSTAILKQREQAKAASVITNSKGMIAMRPGASAGPVTVNKANGANKFARNANAGRAQGGAGYGRGGGRGEANKGQTSTAQQLKLKMQQRQS